MGKQILVMMCAINLDNQRKLLEGMIDAAKETDSNLYVFANYISYKDKLEHIQGSYQIMHLPDFSQFDGVIFAPNTIQYQPAIEHIIKAIADSGIAAVSIEAEFPEMSSFLVDSYEAQSRMVEHFIVDHGAKEIVYVAGVLYRPEGKKRYCAYCDTMRRYGLPLKEENIFEGNFSIEGGVEAAKALLKREKMPEYIICANDGMAAAVIDELKKAGIRVPEDVKVAGFDDAELCELQSPALTTINKKQSYVGYHAVKDIFAQLEGQLPKRYIINCDLIIRRSCGCMGSAGCDLSILKDRYLHSQVHTQKIADSMRNMSADYSGMKRPEDLVEATKKYIEELDMEKFYLCMCEKEKLFSTVENVLDDTVDLQQASSDYTPEITIPLAYEKGVFKEYGKFSKGMVLPEECRAKGGNYYVIVPVYYLRWCYGYCVCGNSRFPLDSGLFYACVMNIGIGLENIRKWMLLQNTVERLNDMWIYDTMTGLYNRAGFYKYAETLYEEIEKANERAFIIFVDVDGLKKINDTLGHKAGDILIRQMADSIKLIMDDNRLAMRYGGDEFVVFGRCTEGETEESILRELRAGMKKINADSEYSFKLSASLGISIYEAGETEGLEKMVELADERMYEEKRKKRERK